MADSFVPDSGGATDSFVPDSHPRPPGPVQRFFKTALPAEWQALKATAKGLAFGQDQDVIPATPPDPNRKPNFVPSVGQFISNLGHTLGSTPTGQAIQQGDYAGAAGTLAPLMTGAASLHPSISAPLARTGTALKAGAVAAAPDVTRGGAMIGAGELLSRLPGMEWPARIALDYPGARRVAAGITKGGKAFEGSWKGKVDLEPPPGTTDTPPAASPQNTPSAPPPPAEDTELLDGLSRSLNRGKPFDKLSSDEQAQIRDVAKRGTTTPATQPPALEPPPGTRAERLHQQGGKTFSQYAEAKNQTIAGYLKDQGISADEWDKMPSATKEGHIQKANPKYSPSSNTPRGFGRTAEQLYKDIGEALRERGR